ncbi:MAG: Asp-tRNA(Asn)/Glu-tRNA(Gln) amidotransferase subunit GatB [Candidatus Aenigmarchaeota archaeon]|nr:Asp-tRNA(Asn)/Glu-tRNA(Gln) amidotransferase subunit GatB [Candidatus Aenigmarchaeota archaeon]
MKIGLEIHTQLLTQTKMFCGCRNEFVKEPNTLTCETCLGFPGSKPRVNKKAIEYGMKVALALNCKFPKETFFSRKSYFYPDLSKNYQITQYEIPLAQNGWLSIGEKRIEIRRINLEEDPARLVHAGDYVLVDYNRSGTPLCEIVTEPSFVDVKEARIFLQKLSSILQYLGVFDPNIEGSMRVDANISVKKERVEVKNISGFKDVEKALNYEIVRQNYMLRHGRKIVRETRGWDPVSGTTKTLRTKEEEEDYGYIMEPDLVKITIDAKKTDELKKLMPEFAEQKVRRYVKETKLQQEIAEAIASEPDLADMFEKVIKKTDVQLAAKWFAGEIKKTLNYNTLRISESELTEEGLVKLLKMVQEKAITERSAEMLLREMVLRPTDPEKAVGTRKRIYDETVLEQSVKQTIAENASAVVDYKSGKQEAFNFLVGQVMRKTEGRGDPATIRKVMMKYLG